MWTLCTQLVVREQRSLVAENKGVTFTDIYMGSSSLTVTTIKFVFDFSDNKGKNETVSSLLQLTHFTIILCQFPYTNADPEQGFKPVSKLQVWMEHAFTQALKRGLERRKHLKCSVKSQSGMKQNSLFFPIFFFFFFFFSTNQRYDI